MTAIRRSLVVLACLPLVLALGTSGHGAAPPARPARVDRYGPPPGAVARLGTARLCPGAPTEALAFSPDGRALVCAGRDGAVSWWDAADGRERGRFRVPARSPRAVSADGRLLAGADNRVPPAAARMSWEAPRDRPADNRIGLWDAASGKFVRWLVGHGDTVRDLALSPDGRRLVSAGADDALRAWDVASGKDLRHWALPARQRSRALAISPDGKTVPGKTIRLHDVRTGKLLRQLSGHEKRVDELAFAPEGRALASRDERGAVRVWDVSTAKILCAITPRKEINAISWLAFAPDGRALATGDRGPHARLWGLPGGEDLGGLGGDGSLWSKEGRGWCVRCASFAPDGKRLFTVGEGFFAVGGSGSGLQVWDVARRAEGARFPPDAREALEGRGPTGPRAVSPDGRFLVRGSGRFREMPFGTVLVLEPSLEALYLHETASGEVVYRFPRGLSTVAFAPDGRTVATGCDDDGSILIWDLRRLYHAPPGARGSEAHSWANLADRDAARAHAAACRLASDEKAALTLLEAHLRPAPVVGRARLGRLVKGLGSDELAVRLGAEVALAEAGEAARPALAGAVRGADCIEDRLRVKRLLRGLHTRSPGRLREVRAVWVLEHLGAARARRLLGRLAGGHTAALLTQEAKAALERLDRRPGAKR